MSKNQPQILCKWVVRSRNFVRHFIILCQVWSIPPQKDSFTVTFILLDLPSPGLEGSTVKLTRVDTPSGEAMQYLKGNITRTGSFVVEFQASGKSNSTARANEMSF